MVKNLICHFYINNVENINIVNKLHLKLLAKYLHIFDGEKIIYVAVDDLTTNKEKIYDIFSFITNAKLKIVQNHPHNRESEYFIEALQSITNTDSLTFYCHNKGSTHALDFTLQNWILAMYFFNLEHSIVEDITQKLSTDYVTSGIMQKIGKCPNLIESEWHYSGAFFWFHTQKLFEIESWRICGKGRMGLESYIGEKIPKEQAWCSFMREYHNFHINDALWNSTIFDNAQKSPLTDSYISQFRLLSP